MANIRISQLPSPQFALTGAELFPIVQNGQTVQTSLSTFANIVGVGSLSFGTTGLTPAVPTIGQIVVGGVLGVANGGTGQTTYTNGQLLIGNSTGNTLTKATLTAGSGISITTGAGSITIALDGTSEVLSFKTSLSGLTPSSATGGAITLAGTLGAASGGTGATTLTGYVYGNGTSVMTASTTIPNTAITGLGTMSTQNANAVAITGGTINGATIGATTASTGAFTYLSTSSTTSTTPTLSFNGSNSNIASGATVSGSYLQNLLQNKSGTAGASVNYVLSNDLGTDSTYYGEFGMNSSVFSASTPADFFSINNGIYFSGHDGDLSIGSGNGFKTYLAWGTTGQSAHVINAAGALGFSTNLGTTPTLSGTTGYGTSGYLLQTAGSTGAPSWVAQSTITAGNATNAANLNLAAGSGATNYITYAATATGNVPQYTSTGLTYNATNTALTGGINGGTF